MQAYFGRAKAACLCSYCCNRHLCYDGERLGRVKIPALFYSPHFLPSFRVSTSAFASKTFACPKKTTALQASFGVLPRLWLLLCTNPGFETVACENIRLFLALRHWGRFEQFANGPFGRRLRFSIKWYLLYRLSPGEWTATERPLGGEVALAQQFL